MNEIQTVKKMNKTQNIKMNKIQSKNEKNTSAYGCV